MTKFFGYAFLCMVVIWLVVSLVKLIADMVAKKKNKRHVAEENLSNAKQLDIDSANNADDK